jgi:hypothetical protein
VVGSFGAPHVQLTTKGTQYSLDYTEPSLYILTINEEYKFTMVNGSLIFSSSSEKNVDQSFAQVVGTTSVLNMIGVQIHFGSVMNCLIYVTGGKVMIDDLIIEDEGAGGVDINWVNPIVRAQDLEGPITVELKSCTVKNSQYKAVVPSTSLNATNSSIVHVLSTTNSNSIKININNSVFTDCVFDMSYRGSSISSFYSSSSDSSFFFFIFFYFFLFFFIVFVVHNCTFKNISQSPKYGFFIYLFVFCL